MNHSSKNRSTYKPKLFIVYIKKNSTDFMKLHVKNFKKLYIWLDKNEPNWRFGNVWFDRRQVGNFTKNNRPDRPYTI
ncbi:hypothetical protein CKK33_11455 [Mucilaginibacter sp. MD40]|nr:hypothetical protein CKK33_11455 [Mucilaginibacter sp. MD40]